MSFCTLVYWACHHWTKLELDLNSMERIIEYFNLPQEPPSTIKSSRPPAYWPSSLNGDNLLVVEDLCIRYVPELPAVLHDVLFNLKVKEQVGLLGHTGSGKSMLVMILLQFVDPSSGWTIIDGIDVCKIGVSDLWSSIIIVLAVSPHSFPFTRFQHTQLNNNPYLTFLKPSHEIT
jgi:ABC-type multidrug transport system fused ATPase/permease subunit